VPAGRPVLDEVCGVVRDHSRKRVRPRTRVSLSEIAMNRRLRPVPVVGAVRKVFE